MHEKRDRTDARVIQLRPVPDEPPEQAEHEPSADDEDDEREADTNVIRFDRTDPPNSAA